MKYFKEGTILESNSAIEEDDAESITVTKMLLNGSVEPFKIFREANGFIARSEHNGHGINGHHPTIGELLKTLPDISCNFFYFVAKAKKYIYPPKKASKKKLAPSYPETKAVSSSRITSFYFRNMMHKANGRVLRVIDEIAHEKNSLEMRIGSVWYKADQSPRFHMNERVVSDLPFIVTEVNDTTVQLQAFATTTFGINCRIYEEISKFEGFAKSDKDVKFVKQINTVIAHLDSLPAEERIKAMSNLDNRYENAVAYTVSYAIMLGVSQETKADQDYWENIQKREISKTFSDNSSFYSSSLLTKNNDPNKIALKKTKKDETKKKDRMGSNKNS